MNPLALQEALETGKVKECELDSSFETPPLFFDSRFESGNF